MSSAMLYLHTLSPLHYGTGQGSGIVDLPITREAITNWPEIPGSGIKGVLRDACRESGVSADILKIVFGPESNNQNDNPSDNAGGVLFTSGRLLCFPVRSFRGTFAWITCPLVLWRWLRDYQILGAPQTLTVPLVPDDNTIVTNTASKATLEITNTVLLEDFDLQINSDHSAGIDVLAQTIAKAVFPEPQDEQWREFFAERFGVVSDDLFGFLTRTTTDVRARVHIDDNRKTVAEGQLWYEETVPIETIFVASLQTTHQGDNQLHQLQQNANGQFEFVKKGIQRPIQLGGNASVGGGLTMARIHNIVAEANDHPTKGVQA